MSIPISLEAIEQIAGREPADAVNACYIKNHCTRNLGNDMIEKTSPSRTHTDVENPRDEAEIASMLAEAEALDAYFAGRYREFRPVVDLTLQRPGHQSTAA